MSEPSTDPTPTPYPGQERRTVPPTVPEKPIPSRPDDGTTHPHPRRRRGDV